MNKFVCIVILLVLVASTVNAQPIDQNATEETVNLFYNLQAISKGSLLIGHEDALAYGLNEDRTRWIDEDNRSDINSITGSHPAVYGWDIGRLELEDSLANIDNVNFDRMRYWIRTGYERGGIITISWHSNNPQTGGDTWDTSGNAPSHVNPGGDKHELYKGWLDRVADFALSLIDSEGKPIPVIFRPYHEHTGGWFWWGRNSSSVEEYKTLWRFTVEYLRDIKGVHNFLYAYSPSTSGVNNESNYLERYPGDEYVDLFGTDDYSNIYNSGQKEAFLRNLRIAVGLAVERNKIAALTETGNELVPDSDWFSTRIVEPIKEDSIARQIAYFLVWRNGRPDHYYAPFPGHQAADDLVTIFEDPFVQFETDLTDVYDTPLIHIKKQFPDLIFQNGTDPVITYNLDDFFEGANSYDISFEEVPGLASLEISGSSLSIMANDLPGKGVYRISGQQGDRKRELMFFITVEEEIPLSVSDHQPGIKIFPNPATEILFIEAQQGFSYYKLFDTHGRTVQSGDHVSRIPLSDLRNGIYYLMLGDRKQQIIRKIIKE